MPKPKKIIKCEEDNIPLPNPFPLPKYYDSDVECALKAKKMTNVTRKSFVGKVVSECYVLNDILLPMTTAM